VLTSYKLDCHIDNPASELTAAIASIYKGTIITAGGYDREQGNAALAAGDG